MLVSFVFFGTQLSVAKIFHITEICSKVSFHDDQCILIQNTAVLKVFQNLTLQFMVIWGIHKYAVKNALLLRNEGPASRPYSAVYHYLQVL